METATPSFFLLEQQKQDSGAWTEVKARNRKEQKQQRRSGRRMVHSACNSSSSTPSNASSSSSGGATGFQHQRPRNNARFPNQNRPKKKTGNNKKANTQPSKKQQRNFADKTLQAMVDENERERHRLKIWNMFFRNVNRSIDELYYLCELDSSEVQCAQAEELLQTYLQEFEQLRARIEAQKAAANQEGGESRESARGLAWEVRKSQASPSPVTVLFGSKLRGDDIAGAETETFLHRRKDTGNAFTKDERVEEDDTRTRNVNIPQSSAWVRKPKIVSDPSLTQQQQLRSSLSTSTTASSSGHVILRSTRSQDARPPKIQAVRRRATSSSNIQESQTSAEEQKEEKSPVVPASVFTFDDFENESNLRWGDEEVGLTEEAMELLTPVSPNRKRTCKVCNRQVIPLKNENTTCSACLSKNGLLRSLHQKLLSPERKKPSPSETRRRQVEKQETAKLNREKIDLQKKAKLRLQSSRQEQVAKTKEEVILAQERAISEKLERAAVAREAKLKSVAKKAENESQKVNEILFINEMTEQERNAQLHKKLEDGEKRRMEFIGTIRGKAEKQTERAEARRLREMDKERQLREAMQRRHEEAEKRKAEALEEQRRKLDEMVVEASAKVSERRTEMEKEREAKLALIKEREERAEQERRKRLLAKTSSGRAITSPDAGFEEDAADSEETGISSQCEEQLRQNREEQDHVAAERAQFAAEVSRASEEMQAKEKAMKKKARKARMKLAQISGPAVGDVEKFDEPHGKLASALKNGDWMYLSRLLLQGDEQKQKLITERSRSSLLAFIDHFEFRDDTLPSEEAMRLIAQSSEKSGGFVDTMIVGGQVSKVVDMLVHVLRRPNLDQSTAPFVIFSLRVLRSIFMRVERGSDYALELTRLCVFSSVAIRIGERCAQMKCGPKWEDSGHPGADMALELVRNSLGLLEAMAITLFSECDTTRAREVLLGHGETCTCFRVISQLLAAFIAVEKSEDSDRAREEHVSRLRVATHSGLRFLNLIGCLNTEMLQDVLSSPELPFELQQLFRYVLSSCTEPGESQLPGPPSRPWHDVHLVCTSEEVTREDLFAEVTVLMGFYALGNEKNQESLNWGRAPTPLAQMLSCVPFSYYTNPIGKAILFPTLVAICFGNSRALAIVAEEVNPSLVVSFLQKEDCHERFPKRMRDDALNFFLKTT